jgi:hypothetical protein
VVPRDSRRERRSGRPRRRPERISVEGLETRQLLAYSPFGYSLPQLAVTGFAANQASWGGSLTVDVTVQNQGASSLVEPLNQAPGSSNNTLNTPPGVSTNSTADSPPTTVEVYGSSRANSTRNLTLLETIDIPGVTQNSTYENISTFALPAKPAGFGNHLFLTLVVNNNQAFSQESNSQNVFHVPKPVTIAAPLPNLQVTAFDIPSSLQPGDVIAPTIRIANLGAADINAQGPVTVELVASLNKTFGPGDSVVGSFVINSLPGLSGVPTQTAVTDDTNLIPLPNTITTTLSPATLPSKPGTYFLGIVIDPTHAINQTRAPSPELLDVVQVGPRDPDLGPTTLLTNTNGAVPVFPALPSTTIGPDITNAALPNIFPPSGQTTTLAGGGTAVVASTAVPAGFPFSSSLSANGSSAVVESADSVKAAKKKG